MMGHNRYYVCDNTILDDVGTSEGQISQSLSQVVEYFNSHGKSLTAQPKKSNLGLGSSSSFPALKDLKMMGLHGSNKNANKKVMMIIIQ